MENNQQNMQPMQQYQAPLQSYFDGRLIQLIGWNLLGGLITAITLGICAPWAMCMVINWEIEHTVIEGRRLRFEGTGGKLFGQWIKWFLLSLITLGIYSFWVQIKLKQWKASHTFFV